MAYRNHPTRYLIVKDRVASPAVAGGQQEAATYAALNPASSTFFKNPPTRLSAAALPVCPEAEERVYAAPSGPSSAFFQSPFRPCGDSAALPFSQRGGSFYASPRGPSTLFFTQPEEPLSLGPRRRFPSARRSVSTLARPARQRFFSIPPRFLATPGRARRGFPQRGLLELLALSIDCQLSFTNSPQTACRVFGPACAPFAGKRQGLPLAGRMTRPQTAAADPFGRPKRSRARHAPRPRPAIPAATAARKEDYERDLDRSERTPHL